MDRQEASLADLFAQLSREMSDLVRQEVDVARLELARKAYHIGKQAGYLALGAALGYAGLLALLGALIVMLKKLGLGWGSSAFVVGFGAAGLGGVLAWNGIKSLRDEKLVPEQTIATLKENAEWAASRVT